MAILKPLVFDENIIRRIKAGDSLDPEFILGGSIANEIELDFGATSIDSMNFTITDANAKGTSLIFFMASAKAPTGRSQDEIELAMFNCRAVSGDGSFDVFIDSLNGPVDGLYKFNYLIS